jgi:flagellar FliJ protein
MTLRERLICLKKFQINEKSQESTQINNMVTELARLTATLDLDITIEQYRSHICDPAHFAYSTYAKAAAQRRENIRHSMNELTKQLDTLKESLGEAIDDLARMARLEDRNTQSCYPRPIFGVAAAYNDRPSV